KVRARRIELDRVGVGENAVELKEVRVRRKMIEVNLRRSRDRASEMESLEREIDTLLAKEVELEVTGASEEEIEKVKTRQMEIDSRLMETRSMVKNARGLVIELEQLRKRERDLERTVNIEERGLELDRLRREARAGANQEEIELTLELEGVRARVRELELELSIKLKLLMAVELEFREAGTNIRERGPSRGEVAKIRSIELLGKEEIARRVMENEEAKYREKMYEMESKNAEIPSEIIIEAVEESEEERANRLAALEEKIMIGWEEGIRERFAILEENERENAKTRAKNRAMSQAIKRTKKKVAEAKSGQRVVIGPIPEDKMRKIAMQSAMVVREQMERKARESAAIEAAKAAREKIKAATKAAKEEVRMAKEAAKEELKAMKKKQKEEREARIRAIWAEIYGGNEEEKEKQEEQ
ncbi:hypothetical protein, partial [Candidatus Ichthyocystis sparus]